MVMVHDDEEPDDGAVPLHNEDSVKNRYLIYVIIN